MKDNAPQLANIGKFQNKSVTADGQTRAKVSLTRPETLWFNTGTLCNIECVNCYIASSPTNDALVYITADEVRNYLDQIEARNWPVHEIGFTGGEPFMNPQMIDMTRAALERGYKVLILTNAMAPMMRRKMREGLLGLQKEFNHMLTLRISVDHFRPALHDEERGDGSFDKTLTGMEWLRDHGFNMAIAGRTVWGSQTRKAVLAMPGSLPGTDLILTRRTRLRPFCFPKWTKLSRFQKSPPRAGEFLTNPPTTSCAPAPVWWSNARGPKNLLSGLHPAAL